MATQQSFFSLAISCRKLRAEKFLNQMTDIIPWQRLIDKIEPFYPNLKFPYLYPRAISSGIS